MSNANASVTVTINAAGDAAAKLDKLTKRAAEAAKILADAQKAAAGGDTAAQGKLSRLQRSAEDSAERRASYAKKIATDTARAEDRNRRNKERDDKRATVQRERDEQKARRDKERTAKEAARVERVSAAEAATKAKESRAEKIKRFGAVSTFAGGGAQGLLGAAAATSVPAAAAAAAFAVVNTVLDKVTAAAEILNDSYATGAQKTRALVSEFVPFGDKIIKLGDALDGTADKIKRNEERYAILGAQDSLRYANRSKLEAAYSEQSGLSAKVAANRKYAIADYKTFDRSTLAGERAAERQDATLGAQDEVTRTARDAEAAKAAAKEADARARLADRRVAITQQYAENVEGLLKKTEAIENGGTRIKATRDEVARASLRAEDMLSRENEAREQAIADAKQKGLAAVQAEAAARAASVNLAKQQLAVLQQQEARMRGLSQAVGAMSLGERMAALNALKAYKDDGSEIPQEIEGLVAKIAPDLVRKNQERRGEAFIQKDVAGALGAKRFGEVYDGDFTAGNTLKDVMAKVDKAKADIRVQIDLDTQDVAEKLVKLLGPVIEGLIRKLEVELRSAERRVRAGNVQRNNAAN